MANQPPDPALIQQLMAQGGTAPAGPPQQGGADTVEILRTMIELAKRYIDADPDPEDKATMAKILATLTKYEADEQREKDAALGTSPAQRYLRRGA